MISIETVIFDLGGVLIGWDPFRVLLESFDNDHTKARWFLDNICDFDWNQQLDKGKNFEEAKREKIAEYPQYAKYITDYHDKWEEMLLGEISGTVEIFKSLKKSGRYRLLAITNWSAEKFPVARKKFPWLTLFDDIVVSGEIKMIKPDMEIYKYALDRFQISNPDSSIFIDDRVENIDMAEKFGVKGIRYKNPGQLAKDLKKLGIKY